MCSRLDLQCHLVKECRLLERILKANAYNDEQASQTLSILSPTTQPAEDPSYRGPTLPSSLLTPSSSGVLLTVLIAQEQATGGRKRCRRGYMGHLFIMSQAIMEAASRHGIPEDGSLETSSTEWSSATSLPPGKSESTVLSGLARGGWSTWHIASRRSSGGGGEARLGMRVWPYLCLCTCCGTETFSAVIDSELEPELVARWNEVS